MRDLSLQHTIELGFEFGKTKDPLLQIGDDSVIGAHRVITLTAYA